MGRFHRHQAETTKSTGHYPVDFIAGSETDNSHSQGRGYGEAAFRNIPQLRMNEDERLTFIGVQITHGERRAYTDDIRGNLIIGHDVGLSKLFAETLPRLASLR